MDAYIAKLQKEYFTFMAVIVRKLADDNLQRYIKELFTDVTTEVVNELSITDLNFLTLLPVSMIEKKIESKTIKIRETLSIRMNALLTFLWKQSFELGRKHQILDIVHQTGLYDDVLEKTARFSSLTDGDLIAHFARRKTAEEKRKEAIRQSKRNLTILSRNIERMKADGSIYNVLNIARSEEIATRMSIGQKAIFLDMTRNIDNVYRRSEAVQTEFLGTNYLRGRIRVLSQDYAQRYDNRVKREVSDFLKENVVGVRQIANRRGAISELRQSISDILQTKPLQLDVTSSATNILRTELSLGYNFGKLSGFIAPEDIDKQFRWNADFELMAKVPGYKVCAWCKEMNGKVFTVRELLEASTSLDGGINAYDGGANPTDFKNRDKPMIPFHPNCSCFWTYVPGGEATTQKALESIVPAIPALVGVGLIASGAFLLARQNAWRSFVAAAVTASRNQTTRTTITTTIDDVTDVTMNDLEAVADILENIEGMELRDAFIQSILNLP